MIHSRRLYATLLSVIALLGVSAIALISQNTGRRSPALVRDRVNENKLVTLAGNTRPEAIAENDLGEVADSLSMEHMLLQLKRSPAQEAAAAAFVADLHDPKSQNFHKWVTAEEFGKNFGAAEADIAAVTTWLESHGFKVETVYPSGMVIDFTGGAGQVRRAFHTSIHNVNGAGERHIANFGDPQIPAALAPVIAGVVSIHDFRPHRMSKAKYTYTSGGQLNQLVAPADLATIYDFNPLYAKGITGTGQTIVAIEDTDLYTTTDWNTFRSTFGLTAYGGTLTTQHPKPTTGNNCRAPGINSDDVEAILDVEWASAAAPGAAIINAACASTSATFGGFIAMQNIINAASPPTVMSISYNGCEAENGVSFNASISTLYQQAAAEGISVFVAAGDEGAASCDAGALTATHGIGTGAYATTQYNVAVGGTDFSDTLDSTTGKYWATKNSTADGSALSYIPEIPWNGSCASSLVASFYNFPLTYGPTGFCASSTALSQGWVSVSGGSGGPSSCASGAPANYGYVGGSCKGVSKPSWQTGLAGIPNDGVRDIPDVSMFASNGVWGHYYIACFSDQSNGGTPCTGTPDNWAGFGGTSISSPIMAGIQALVNQSTGAAQGNPNTVYYALAVSTPSVFHSISRGDITQNCAGTQNCYGPIGFAGTGRGGRPSETSAAGALSVSSTAYTPAYTASPASWNFATGIGSVDANNLVTNWPKH